MKVLIIIVIYGLFFLMCYLGTGTLKKNMKSFYSYPDEIQNRVRNNELLANMIPKPKTMMQSFISNLILFSIVFILVGLLFPEESFVGCFVYFIILGQGLNLFDLLVIDLSWWRNTQRTQIEGLDADRELYQNPGKHVAAFYRGILMFLCVAFISAVVLRPEEIYIILGGATGLFTTALITLLFCMVMFLLIWAGVALHPMPKLLSFMPGDIQEKLKDHKPPFKGANILGLILMLIRIVALIGLMVYMVWEGIQNGFTFGQFFARFLIVLYGEKMFDILFLDYFLITRTNFFQHYWPETEGCEGYNQFGYNKKEQMVRLIFLPFVCALFAWICTIIW